MCVKQEYAIHSRYIFLWRLCTGRLAGLEMWGAPRRVLVWHNKQARGVHWVYLSCIIQGHSRCELYTEEICLCKDQSVFLAMKNTKTLGLSEQPEERISAIWFEFCLCSRPFWASSCTWVVEWIEKMIPAAFATCTVKVSLASWGTKHFGCAKSQHCLSHWPLRMRGSRDATLQGVLLLCCAVPSSGFRILCSTCYVFNLCGQLCRAVWSSCFQEKSFYSESKSNLSEWWQEKQWVQSITSLAPPFHTGNDSLCAQILSVSQLRSYELKSGIDFSQYWKV